MDPSTSVSFVIVTWNPGEHLEVCLRSLAEHPPPGDWDVTIVDNGSTDGSLDQIEHRFPSVRVIRNRRNRGLAAANNQGITVSSGETICICNPDVIFEAGSVAGLLDTLARRPRAAFAVPRLRQLDGSLQTAAGDLPTLREALLGYAWTRRRAWDGSSRSFWWGGWAHDEERAIGHGAEAAYLVRRAALGEIGVQDEAFRLDWEGIDWAARVNEAGWEVWFTPSAEIVHVGGTSIQQATARWIVSMHLGMARYFRKHHGIQGLIAQPLIAARAVIKLLGARIVPFYDRARVTPEPAKPADPGG